MPVPRMPRVMPCASRAPRWAQESMPSAAPLAMPTPRSLKVRARLRAVFAPLRGGITAADHSQQRLGEHFQSAGNVHGDWTVTERAQCAGKTRVGEGQEMMPGQVEPTPFTVARLGRGARQEGARPRATDRRDPMRPRTPGPRPPAGAAIRAPPSAPPRSSRGCAPVLPRPTHRRFATSPRLWAVRRLCAAQLSGGNDEFCRVMDSPPGR